MLCGNVITSIMSIIGKTCLRIGAYLILHCKQCNIKYIVLVASSKNAHALQYHQKFIKPSFTYSIMVDECTNASNKEQLVLCFRYVDADVDVYT